MKFYLFIFNRSSKISVRHYPNRPPQPPAPSTAHLTQLSPSSTDDMNATLLKSNDNSQNPIKRELFGSFKGFSLKPLPMSKPNITGASNVAYVHPVAKKPDTIEIKNEHCVPSRVAPLPPTNSPKKNQIKTSPISVAKSSLTSSGSTSSSYRYQNINATNTVPETPIEVKLFAKPDKERPKISNPVLENSTCSVKEMIAAANSVQNPSKSKINETITKQTQAEKTKEIPIKKLAAEKSSLKKIEISAPMKTVNFGRSHSMRSPSNEKPPQKRNVLASGSMRLPAGSKRRNSIVDRPKNPPPPRPIAPQTSIDSLQQTYANIDRSIENSTDNIYCVIEDIKNPVETSSTNGLLSEIVNEIESRNIASIYSTSKKQNPSNASEQQQYDQTIYENIQCPDKNEDENFTNDNIYMNTANITETNSQKNDQINNKVKNPSFTNKMSTPSNSGIESVAKKFNSNTAPGKSKPVIAAKPAVSSLIEQKSANKEAIPKITTNKSFATSKPATSNSTNKWNNKATINPTSNVRSLHKRFENFNA